jgi:peptide/nickel transport system permease protein
MRALWRGIRSLDRSARIAAAALVALALACIAIPWLSPGDPLAIGDVLGMRLLPPLAEDANGSLHILGTDRFGRDLFVRMMLMALADALLSIPRLVLLLVCAALWQPGLTTVVVVLISTGWMGVARMIRAEVLGVAAQPYVQSAVALGMSSWRVLWRHALPNALGPAIVATTLGVGNAILLESGLSFLGMGIQPPQPSWGNMIAGGRDLIVTAPWVAIAPGIALVGTVLAATLIGDALRDRLAGERVTGRRDLADRA